MSHDHCIARCFGGMRDEVPKSPQKNSVRNIDQLKRLTAQMTGEFCVYGESMKVQANQEPFLRNVPDFFRKREKYVRLVQSFQCKLEERPDNSRRKVGFSRLEWDAIKEVAIQMDVTVRIVNRRLFNIALFRRRCGQ